MRRSLIALISLCSAVSLVAGAAFAGLPIYVFPQVDGATRSDVIYIIGPPTATRLQIAETLLTEGKSDNLMISVPDRSVQSRQVKELCAGGREYRVYCFEPEPFTTQGEARWLASMTKIHNWSHVTVITFTPHITRARIIFQRCFSGDLDIIPDKAPLGMSQWIYEYVYQTGAFLKVAVDSSC